MTPYMIGIAGPSCSGKSEVARRLARILRAPVLAVDHYYRDLAHLSFTERLSVNFDEPAAIDDELLVRHAGLLRTGLPVEQPVYDFRRHTRAAESETIAPGDYVIVEGLFALCWPELREHLDFGIYISADHDTCLARRIFRDVRERGRTEASIREQYERTVRPMADLHVLPTVSHADLVLAGIAPLKQATYTALLYIAERVEERRRSAVRNVILSWSHEAAD